MNEFKLEFIHCFGALQLAQRQAMLLGCWQEIAILLVDKFLYSRIIRLKLPNIPDQIKRQKRNR